MGNEQLDIITLNADNIDTEHICCAIGKDKINLERSNTSLSAYKNKLKLFKET